MKSLNTYVIEGLADWSDDKLDKKISKQTSRTVIKKEITDWIVNNTYGRIYKNKLKFNFDTDPITIDYEGDIELNWKVESLTNGLFQWGNIGENFNCKGTRITSLEGAPKKVKWFNCSHTNIESLEGCPENTLRFECISCPKLKTLEGGPKQTIGYFCESCENLESLKGGPISTKKFSCFNCPKLKSLDGCPQQAEDFNCRKCYNITSLKGCPKELLGDFDCSGTGIKNLKGGPIKAKNYNCSECKNLVSLDGGPEQVGFNFYCYNCPKLKSLEKGPEIIHPESNSTYDCSGTAIKDLKGAPEKVQRFICNSCDNLISLEGCPHADYLIDAQCCPNLKSLKHIPLDAKCNLMVNSTPIEDVGDLYNSMIKFIYFSQNCPAKDELRKYLNMK